MAVDDLWVSRRSGEPTRRHGRGRRWRVRVDGYPASLHRTRVEAEVVELDRLRAGPPRPASTVTVGGLLDRWLAGKAHLSPKGRSACRVAAAQVRARWGGVLAGSVAAQDVREWLAGLQSLDMSAPRVGGCAVILGSAAAGTRQKALQALRGALEIGVESGVVVRNPCAGIRVGGGSRDEARYLLPGELAALAGAARGDGALVWWLGLVGSRVGETVALDVGDVVASRGRARVRWTKTGEARDVAVPASVLAMLDLSRAPGVPLFVSSGGCRVHVDNWRARVFRPAVVAAGVGSLRIHDLRHTAASLMIASGADVKVVQRQLGHRSARMTLDLYGHLWDQGLDDVAARMDAFVL